MSYFTANQLVSEGTDLYPAVHTLEFMHLTTIYTSPVARTSPPAVVHKG